MVRRKVPPLPFVLLHGFRIGVLFRKIVELSSSFMSPEDLKAFLDQLDWEAENPGAADTVVVEANPEESEDPFVMAQFNKNFRDALNEVVTLWIDQGRTVWNFEGETADPFFVSELEYETSAAIYQKLKKKARDEQIQKEQTTPVAKKTQPKKVKVTTPSTAKPMTRSSTRAANTETSEPLTDVITALVEAAKADLTKSTVAPIDPMMPCSSKSLTTKTAKPAKLNKKKKTKPVARPRTKRNAAKSARVRYTPNPVDSRK